MKKVLALIALLCMFVPYAIAVRDEIPRNMIYMDVYLIDKDTGKEIETERFEAGWGMGAQNLSNCKRTAGEEAKKRHLQNWDYYCCTVTSDNPCVTKVRK